MVATGGKKNTNLIRGCTTVSSLWETQTRGDIINWSTCILAGPIITAVTLGTVIIVY